MVWGALKRLFAQPSGPIHADKPQQNTHISSENALEPAQRPVSHNIQEIKALFEQEKLRVTSGFMVLDDKIKAHSYEIDNLSFAFHQTHKSIEDLKIAGKLTIEHQDRLGLLEKRMHDIENRLRNMDSTFSKRLVNLSELNQQHSLNFSQPEPGLRVGLPTYENQQQGPLNLEMFTKRLVNLAKLTRTEKAVLIALYELQADMAERGVPVKEIVDRIYGKKAKHSKLVYIAKLTKEMVARGVLEKVDSGAGSKLYLAPDSIEFSSHLVAQRH